LLCGYALELYEEYMKKLYLVRHAKSSWKHPDLDDFERPLSKRGKRDGPIMGRFLRDKDILLDILISSPAVRAKKTAKIIAKNLAYSKNKIKFDHDIYEASTKDLLIIFSNINDKHNTVMLVGHNPSMTYLANMLASCRIDNIPTCGIVCIELNITSWKEISENCGELIFFEYPKNLI
jgi:phosphohistidine phosphatase